MKKKTLSKAFFSGINILVFYFIIFCFTVAFAEQPQEQAQEQLQQPPQQQPQEQAPSQNQQSQGETQSPEENVKNVFKGATIEKIEFNPAIQMYEITVQGKIFYLTKDLKYVILGQIIDVSSPSTPVNLTSQKEQKLIQEIIKTIDKSAAFKIGNGPVEIIEIVSPDCGHCKNLVNHLKNKKELTRYIFFVPWNPAKVNYILCQKNYNNQLKAYEEVFYKNKQDVPQVKACEFSERQSKVMKNLQIQAVPMVFINGQIVQGANLNLIDSLIKGAQK